MNCKSIKTINIPTSVTRIGYEAFLGCTAMESITIPSSVMQIEYRAIGYKFKEGSTIQIEKIDDFKIYCYKGTAGEQYAIDNGFDYEYVKPANYPGNVNGDGLIDVGDAAAIIGHINGVKTLF